jgi:hypothetical protein
MARTASLARQILRRYGNKSPRLRLKKQYSLGISGSISCVIWHTAPDKKSNTYRQTG